MFYDSFFKTLKIFTKFSTFFKQFCSSPTHQYIKIETFDVSTGNSLQLTCSYKLNTKMANPNYDIDQPYAIHLFRSNLRISDNPSLNRCLEYNLPTLPLYCLNINEWDRKWYVKESLGTFRKRFLIESLDDLDTTIRLKGGRLYVDEQDPLSTIQNLYNSYCGLKVIVTTIEPDPPNYNNTSLQDEIEAFGREYGIETIA